MKYNDNGEYKDIYIKTFDTLPVGTEVDYDGETVPDGWTQIDNLVIDSGISETFTTVNGYVDKNITFNKTFTEPPTLSLTINGSTTNTNYEHIAIMYYNVTTSGATIRVVSSFANLYPQISWIAIGK